jgi:hypothetical protein
MLVVVLFLSVLSIREEPKAQPLHDSNLTNSVLEKLNSQQSGISIAEKKILYDKDDNIFAFAYSLLPEGYAIVSHTGEFLEVSFEGPSPYLGIENQSYYFGYLNYFKRSGKELIHCFTDDIITNSELSSGSYSTHIPSNQLSGINYVLPGTPARLTAISSKACTVTGIAILLNYHHRYFTGNFYPVGVTTATGLRDYLINNKFVFGNGGLYLSSAITTHIKNSVSYKGLRSFLSSVPNVTNKVLYLGSYSLSNTINVIHGEGRPILIDINTSALNPEKTSRHVVFAYGLGYDAQLSPAQFIIVNDGWGNNNVWVNSSMLNGTETLKMQK